MRKKVLRSPRRTRRERTRRARTAFLWMLLAAALAVGFFYLLLRPELAIREIRVSQDGAVLEGEVIALVQGHLAGAYAGVVPKNALVLYQKAAIEKAVAARFPSLAEVRAERAAGGVLQLKLRARRPTALWCPPLFEFESDADASCLLMDETGFVFGEASAGDAALPRLRAPAPASAALGTFALKESRLAALRGLHARLKQLGLPPEELRLRAGEGVEAALQGGARLLFGEEATYDAALARLATLLGEQHLIPRRDEKLRVDYLDLRYGNKVYFKPR